MDYLISYTNWVNKESKIYEREDKILADYNIKQIESSINLWYFDSYLIKQPL